MIRFFDFFLSGLAFFVLLPVFICLFILGYFDTGSPLFIQPRMGLNKKTFYLIKFRSMHINTPSLPTHLNNFSSITKFGRFLRSSKLDELPQLLNVLGGSMSLVGPRPNLLDQHDLIRERLLLNVYRAKPGLTGLSQVNNIDMSNPVLLAKTDSEMLKDFNLLIYFKIIFITLGGKGFSDKIIRRT